MTQLTLDDIKIQHGKDLKEDGIRKVLDHADPNYKSQFEQAIRRLPLGATITAEDLTRAAGRPNSHVNTVGALMNSLAKRGFIRKTGRMVRAERPSRHAAELREWVIVKHA